MYTNIADQSVLATYIELGARGLETDAGYSYVYALNFIEMHVRITVVVIIGFTDTPIVANQPNLEPNHTV